MKMPRRWDPCIYHRGAHAEDFVRHYLSQGDRRVLMVAGGGFDPRSTRVSEMMIQAAPGRVRGVYIREERPNPAPELVRRAELNCARLREWLPDATIRQIQVLATDNAPVGGRNAVALIDQIAVYDTTDIFVDVSALSLGVAFPLIKHLLGMAAAARFSPPVNMHVVVMDEPPTDHAIRSIPGDQPAPIHGFRGGWGLDERSRAATLWMPQLSRGKQAILRQIHQVLKNAQKDTVVCPILPFPSAHPRLTDELIEEYSEELREDTWHVDARDLIYADEKSPVDLYRTILRIDEARSRVFAAVGGSQIILSPVGSKALSLGALMAALERNFTVMYVEAIGYTADFELLDSRPAAPSGELVHLWLHGEAYGSPIVTEGVGT
jgi:hypothetical protein